jgi:hypothetical protein
MLKPGESYHILATQPSDLFLIPTSCSLRRLETGKWEIRSNASVRIRLPEKGQWQLSGEGITEQPILTDSEGFVSISVTALTNGVGILSLSK